MSKRGQNEGSIFEEKPWRWVALLTLGYEVRDGKRRRIRKKFTAKSRKAAQKKLTEALREQQTGGAVPIQKDTLGVYLDTWVKKLSKKRKPSTIANYEWAIGHIKPALGNVPLTKLEQKRINEFMEDKVAAGLSAPSVRNLHRVLRSALSRAVKDGLANRNAAKLADPHAGGHSRVEPLTPDQARRFLDAVSGDRLEALYTVAFALGLRRGKAVASRVVDVDLQDRTLRVQQTMQRIRTNPKGEKGKRSKLVINDPKTESSQRSIPLPVFAIEGLKRHLERGERERAFAGERWKDTGLLFTTMSGTALEPRNVVRHFHKVLNTLKLPHHRFHDLRHTAASLLLAQGATLHEVKEILGHSQIAVTADLYGHAYVSVMRESVDRVGSLLAPQATTENPVAPSLAPSGVSKAIS